MTRDVTSEAAKALKKRNVDVVTADLNDKVSLVKVSIVHAGPLLAQCLSQP